MKTKITEKEYNINNLHNHYAKDQSLILTRSNKNFYLVISKSATERAADSTVKLKKVIQKTLHFGVVMQNG